jgi:hypothetical protein
MTLSLRRNFQSEKLLYPFSSDLLSIGKRRLFVCEEFSILQSCFDDVALDNEGAFVVKYSLPYVEYEPLSREALEQL